MSLRGCEPGTGEMLKRGRSAGGGRICVFKVPFARGPLAPLVALVTLVVLVAPFPRTELDEVVCGLLGFGVVGLRRSGSSGAVRAVVAEGISTGGVGFDVRTPVKRSKAPGSTGRCARACFSASYF